MSKQMLHNQIINDVAIAMSRDKRPVTEIGVTMAKTKKKVSKRVWSKNDVKMLRSLAKKRVGVAKISKSLKRTVGAVAVKASQLDISLDTRG